MILPEFSQSQIDIGSCIENMYRNVEKGFKNTLQLQGVWLCYVSIYASISNKTSIHQKTS